jgi:hypothetical protein
MQKGVGTGCSICWMKAFEGERALGGRPQGRMGVREKPLKKPPGAKSLARGGIIAGARAGVAGDGEGRNRDRRIKACGSSSWPRGSSANLWRPEPQGLLLF